tara:strand:- start:577 stop:1614 length:1038 start_codon:yes stop_codon:yes gene_type:complete
MKGGGSSAPTTQTVRQTNLPEYAAPYVERVFARAEAESNQPYTPYGGQRIADFSSDELTAQGMGRGFAFAGTPKELTDASFGLSSIVGSNLLKDRDFTSGFEVNPYQRADFDTSMSRYMNPYQQSVVDIAKREAIRDSAKTGLDIASKAATSGGLGGYREAIMQAERERNLGQRLSDIQTKGSDLAFRQALDQYRKDQALGLQERKMDIAQAQLAEKFRQDADKLGLVADQTYDRAALEGTKQLTNLGGAISKDALARIGALESIGKSIRAMEQAGLDIGYGDFINQRDYTTRQLGNLANLLYGSAPLIQDARVSTYDAQPGLFQNVFGTGLAGAGLFKSLRGEV